MSFEFDLYWGSFYAACVTCVVLHFYNKRNADYSKGNETKSPEVSFCVRLSSCKPASCVRANSTTYNGVASNCTCICACAISVSVTTPICVCPARPSLASRGVHPSQTHTLSVHLETTTLLRQQFKAFQRNYLCVYLLAMFADWLKGPYVYALYSCKFEKRVSNNVVYFVCTDFGSPAAITVRTRIVATLYSSCHHLPRRPFTGTFLLYNFDNLQSTASTRA
jgi:hypothetical protein